MVAAALPVIAVAVAIGLLVAGLVWAYQNVEWFRTAVQAVGTFLTETLWPAIKTGAEFLGTLAVGAFDLAGKVGGALVSALKTGAEWFAKIWGAIETVIGWFGDLAEWPGKIAAKVLEHVGGVKGTFDDLVDFVAGLPGRVVSAAAGLWDGITDTAKSAFNAVAKFWNDSVGAIGFTVPEWVPLVGGKSWNVPNLPILHDGGLVPGNTGDDVLILAQAGERVISSADVKAGNSYGAGGDITVGDIYAFSPAEAVETIARRTRAAVRAA
jgi:hypothetical protein